LCREDQDRIWELSGPGRAVRAILLSSRRSLFPVLRGQEDVPVPRFINRFLTIHAIQGLPRETAIFEHALRRLGREAAEAIDYDLMALDGKPNPEALGIGPEGLVLKPPEPRDRDALFSLQAAYEQEEVLPRGAVFDPASCFLSLGRILSREQVLVAELGSRIVGKINTNAASFTRRQIGGVYVLPEYRGRGIAVRMGAALAEDLISRGMGVTLFVKKGNPAARAVYRRIGFRAVEDYRICYYYTPDVPAVARARLLARSAERRKSVNSSAKFGMPSDNSSLPVLRLAIKNLLQSGAVRMPPRALYLYIIIHHQHYTQVRLLLPLNQYILVHTLYCIYYFLYHK
jgi:ribosomal protein S18 acetylase RimI-like enzyme